MATLKYIRILVWLAVESLALVLVSIAVMYFSFRSDINFLRMKPLVVHDLLWRTSFYLHISGGIIAILVGPVQFLSFLRRRFVILHRSLGKIYVGSILILGAPFGFYMALYANGGQWASTGFAVMSMLWFYTTWMAYSTAKHRRFTEHRRWMMRSYALTFSAVTLRLWVPFCSIWFAMDPEFVIRLSAWVSWAINLVIVEMLIALERKYKLSFVR